MAKYSIILPVRNGGQFVKECVDSILSQTYADFNFIVLDNCSTDGTFEWILAQKDERIIIVPSDKPLTIEENWGRIKAIDKNEFITLVGHDDILYPGFLQVIDRLVTTHPNAALYHTHFNFIDAKNNIIRPCKPMQLQYNGYQFLEAFLTNSIDLMGTGYVMRSSDYDEIGGISERYPNLLFADFELWLKASLKSYEVVAPETYFSFRVHKSATSTSQDKKLHQALNVFTNFLNDLQQDDLRIKNIIKEFGADFLLINCKGLCHRLLRTPINKRENLTVNDLINYVGKLAAKLGIQDQYKPEKVFSIKLAAIIDTNVVSRRLFLFFKKFIQSL